MSLLALCSYRVNKPRLVELQSPVVCSAVGLQGAGEMWDKSSALLQFSSSTLCQGIQRIFLSCLAASCGCRPALSPSARAMEGDDQPLHAGSAVPTPGKALPMHCWVLAILWRGSSPARDRGAQTHAENKLFYSYRLQGLVTCFHYSLFHCKTVPEDRRGS